LGLMGLVGDGFCESATTKQLPLFQLSPITNFLFLSALGALCVSPGFHSYSTP